MTTTSRNSHLTEHDRQSLADGSLDAARRRDAELHLATCGECTADVRRLENLMRTIRSAPPPVSDVPDVAAFWPGIQSRIEQAKIVALHGAHPVTTRRRALRWTIFASAAVAALVLFAMPVVYRNRAGESPKINAPNGLVPVADSLQSYEEEARVLLNHLEVERAVMRPEASAVIDRDLKTIDAAIDELKLAIASDPRNLALRQLLAASYRQKVDLLKRASNAG